MRSRFRSSVIGAGLMSAMLFAVGAGGALAHDHGDHGHHSRHHDVLYVSPDGQSGASDESCDSAAYTTVSSAVQAAPAGGTVFVCSGTYTEDVIISSPLTLTGHDATINGSPTASGQCDQLGAKGPGSAPCLAGITIKASHVTVEGLSVKGAIGEGILATGSLSGGSISDIRIEDNTVVGNNTGGIPPTPNSPYPQCSEFGQIPGDCGEGIHLMGVYDSKVVDNYVSGNEGGVLLTDEFGPTHDNLVANNDVTKNPFDCGITVPGHNPNALDASGNRQPDVAGVYDNVIAHNRITDNGLQGEGAGVLFANATAGTGSYDNLVIGNYIAGNSLSGVTMHAHTLGPNQFEDLNGNTIVRNVIGQNNLGSPVTGPGDSLDGSVTDPFTTGILVFSASVPQQVTIAHNRIFDNHFGIWLAVAGNVTAKLRHNRFRNVDTNVFTSP